ncbi:hypothetical protein PoB_004829300 [Plakobranchus ocellatus]|uniref:Uncharacterized protein n=1 Tax=Plakobranchus ocellatus TaxID=259542 RepID=A0AAV4BQD2_9GAST|nr:hypothetical protein PoB_004829300 [Plakobranchus ocellatus]
MPFKTLFRSQKKIKQSTKRAVHFIGEKNVNTLEEPPDGEHILDQIRQMKLQKQKATSNGNDKSSHSNGNSVAVSTNGFTPPPLYRAATEPLPVISHSARRRSSGWVKKSLSQGDSLDSRHSPEFDLHDRRLKELTQLGKSAVIVRYYSTRLATSLPS